MFCSIVINWFIILSVYTVCPSVLSVYLLIVFCLFWWINVLISQILPTIDSPPVLRLILLTPDCYHYLPSICSVLVLGYIACIARCGLLLPSSQVPWSVCVLGTLMGPAKTYEPIEMPLGRSRLATAEGIIRSGTHCDLLLNFLRYLIQKGFITYDFLLVFRI